MSQSSVLVATLAAAFLLYLAASGRLSVYSAAVLGPAKSSSGGGSSGGGIGGTISKGVGIAKDVGEVASVFA